MLFFFLSPHFARGTDVEPFGGIFLGKISSRIKEILRGFSDCFYPSFYMIAPLWVGRKLQEFSFTLGTGLLENNAGKYSK